MAKLGYQPVATSQCAHVAHVMLNIEVLKLTSLVLQSFK